VTQPLSHQPTDEDEDLALELQGRQDELSLRRAGDEPACAGCAHYLLPDAALAYCWHPDVRMLVDAGWRCRHHTPADVDG
jgi:hypothetical protein